MSRIQPHLAPHRLLRPSIYGLFGAALFSLTSLVEPLPGTAQTVSPSPPFFSPSLQSSYTLGPGDRILINLFQAPEYSGENQVLVDGSLNLALAGSVNVQGMTLQQAAAAISARYAPYFRRPIVTVNLLASRPLRIGISGEVSRPGSYTIPVVRDQSSGGQVSAQLPTLTEAIQLAGGLTPSANLRQIQIRRSQTQNGSPSITVNLWDVLQTGELGNNVSLRDGDTVFVPTNLRPDLAEVRRLAGTNLYANAKEPVNIAVVGAVRRPGTYTLAPTPNTTTENAQVIPTVTQAIQTAGGITEIADIRAIQIRRQSSNGPERTLDVDLSRLLREGELNQDTVLQEGDTVVIPTATAIDTRDAALLGSSSLSPRTIRVYVVGEARTPGAVEVPPNTSLNQAILAAGGFDVRRANRNKVNLIRLNPDGTANRREIEIDFAQGLNEENNPPLRNNDVIVVRRSGLAGFTDTTRSFLEPLGTIFPFLRLFGL